MLSGVEHEKCFYNLGARFSRICSVPSHCVYLEPGILSHTNRLFITQFYLKL